MTATLSVSLIFPALKLRHLIFLVIHSPFEVFRLPLLGLFLFACPVFSFSNHLISFQSPCHGSLYRVPVPLPRNRHAFIYQRRCGLELKTMRQSQERISDVYAYILQRVS